MMRAALISARWACQTPKQGAASTSMKRHFSGTVTEKPILVTGARGRVASLLITELVKADRPVLAVGRTPPKDPVALWGPRSAQLVEFVQCNLMDQAAMDAVVDRSGDVLHVGALPGPSSQTPAGIDPAWGTPEKAPVGLEKESSLQLLEENFVGTCRLFERVARKRDGCRVVYSSSLFANGYAHDPDSFQPPQLPLTEDQPTLPLETYGFSKFATEEFANMLVRTSGNVPTALGESPVFVHIRFSNMIKVENWHLLPWEGRNDQPIMWTYCHELDVVDAHLKALNIESSAFPSRSETFFIISDDSRTNVPTMELIQQRWEAKGVAPPQLSQPLPGFTSIASNSKAKRILGWVPRTFRK